MDNGQFFGPFMDDYFAECDGHLTSLRRALLELEEGSAPPAIADELLRGIFRNLHTLKGLSGMVGFPEAETTAHALEEWLRSATAGGAQPGAAALNPLFEGASFLERCLNARRSGSTPLEPDDFLSQLQQSSAAAAAASAPATTSSSTRGANPGLKLSAAESSRLEAALQRGDRLQEFDFIPSPELVARGIGVESIRSRLGEIGEILHATPRALEGRRVAFRFLVALSAAPPEEWRNDGLSWSTPAEPSPDSGAGEQSASAELLPSVAAASAATAGVSSSNMVRVDLGRLDELMRLVGELVISRSRLDDLLAHAGKAAIPAAELEEINAGMERQLRDLREGVMRVRLVPVGEAFERMRFVVREVSSAEGKDVRVELKGQDTGLDKLVVERIMEPLLHLVRNAISHGLETPTERLEKGKSRQGRITLSAATAGERVRVEVEDDGRGIDREAVAERARSQGIPVPVEPLDDEALLDLICTPGFSTREVADLASGRGVGMDVVRSTIHALGGQLRMSTESGSGSRFCVELPLTLMIVDALLVRIGDQIMAVPQPALLEVLKVETSDVVVFENNEVIRHRERVLPVLRLRRLFGIRGSAPKDAFPVLVVGSEAQPIGLAVDELLDLREIVVRSLTDPLVAVPGIAAATELGDGRVCLILDSAELVQMALGKAGGAGLEARMLKTTRMAGAR